MDLSKYFFKTFEPLLINTEKRVSKSSIYQLFAENGIFDVPNSSLFASVHLSTLKVKFCRLCVVNHEYQDC